VDQWRGAPPGPPRDDLGQIEIAVSIGVAAPMSRPQGPTIRASCSGPTPAAVSRRRRSSSVRRLPSVPM